MCKSLVSRMLAGLCVTALAAPWLKAQIADTSAPAAPVPGASAMHAERLTNEAVRRMLEADQYQFTVDPQNSGLFVVKVQRGTWTFYVTVGLSTNGNFLWFSERLNEIADPDQVPAARLLSLLEASHDVQPAQFYYSAASRGIYLAMPLQNERITRDDVRQALYYFVDMAGASEGAWNTTTWETMPSAPAPIELPAIPAPAKPF